MTEEYPWILMQCCRSALPTSNAIIVTRKDISQRIVLILRNLVDKRQEVVDLSEVITMVMVIIITEVPLHVKTQDPRRIIIVISNLEAEESLNIMDRSVK